MYLYLSCIQCGNKWGHSLWLGICYQRSKVVWYLYLFLYLYLSSICICLVFDVVTNEAIPCGWASVTREADRFSICICICICICQVFVLYVMWLQMGPFLMVGHLLPEKQRCLVDCPTQPSPSITISIHQHHLFLFNFYLHVYNWIYSAISFIQHCICHTQPSQSITISVHQHHLFLFNFLQCVFIQHFTTAKFLSSSFE